MHARENVRVEKDELKRLRDYVRRSFKIMLDLDKSKNKALGILDEIGFGEFKKFTSKKKDKD